MKIAMIAAVTLAAVAMPALAQPPVTHTTTVVKERTVHRTITGRRKMCSTHWGPHHRKITKCWYR